MFLQEQHVSTQLRGHYQAGIVMKFKMAVHKQFAYGNCLRTAIFNLGCNMLLLQKHFNIITKDIRVVFDGSNLIVFIAHTNT
jgi:hypothetical protein